MRRFQAHKSIRTSQLSFLKWGYCFFFFFFPSVKKFSIKICRDKKVLLFFVLNVQPEGDTRHRELQQKYFQASQSHKELKTGPFNRVMCTLLSCSTSCPAAQAGAAGPQGHRTPGATHLPQRKETRRGLMGTLPPGPTKAGCSCGLCGLLTAPPHFNLSPSTGTTRSSSQDKKTPTPGTKLHLLPLHLSSILSKKDLH